MTTTSGAGDVPGRDFNAILDELYAAENAERFDAGAVTSLGNELIAAESAGDVSTATGGQATKEDVTKSAGRSDSQSGSRFSGAGLLLKAKADAALAERPQSDPHVDALQGIDGSGAIAYHSAFVEAGYNYLASVRDGDPEAVVQGRKKAFERTLISEPAIDVLPDDRFAEAAFGVLRRVSEQFGIPMNNAYRADRPADDSSHSPLSLDEVKALLAEAEAITGGHKLAKIQVRLNDAVEGMTSPRPIDGPVAERSKQIDVLYVNGLRDGNLGSLAEQIHALMKAP